MPLPRPEFDPPVREKQKVQNQPLIYALKLNWKLGGKDGWGLGGIWV